MYYTDRGGLMFYTRTYILNAQIRNEQLVCVCLELCATLCNSMDYSWPGSSVHGIIQARILQWVPFLLPGDLPNPRIEPVFPASPALGVRFFTTEPPGKSTYL